MSRCNDFAEVNNESEECKRTKTMHYVYILQSFENPEHFYIGCTNDLKRRIREHNSGASNHTNKFKPWNLRGYVAFDTEEKAYRFEHFLKTGNGRVFQKKYF